MKRSRFSVLAVAACLALAGPSPTYAQLGGLIKKKVGDAVKGPDKAAEKAKAPGATADNSPIAPFTFDADTKKAFIAGLQVEIDARAAFRKKIAALKTPQQYESCKQSALMNPEGQQMSQDYMAAMSKLGDNSANKKPEQLQKETQDLAEQFTKRTTALDLKYCGEDPAPIRNSQRQEFERAETLGAMEFGKVLDRKPPDADDGALIDALVDESCVAHESAALAEGDAVMPVAHCHAAEPRSRFSSLLRVRADTASDEAKKRVFSILKEWVDRYCQLTPAQKADAEKNGIKIPGQGQGIYWVFSKDFAQWVDGDCDNIKKMLAQLQ